MRMAFVTRVLKSLIEEEVLHLDDSILTVCAAEGDRDVFLSFGFKDVMISNLDDRRQEHGYPPFKWSRLLVVLSPIFKKQGNDFAMVALRPNRPDDLWPWLVMDGETVDLNRAYVKELAERRKLPPH